MIVLILSLIAPSCLAAPGTSENPVSAAAAAAPGEKIRYRQGKDIDFESLLIQGQLKRPEFSVVTGNGDEGGDGVLRLRENFIEPMTADLSEEIPQ